MDPTVSFSSFDRSSEWAMAWRTASVPATRLFTLNSSCRNCIDLRTSLCTLGREVTWLRSVRSNPLGWLTVLLPWDRAPIDEVELWFSRITTRSSLGLGPHHLLLGTNTTVPLADTDWMVMG